MSQPSSKNEMIQILENAAEQKMYDNVLLSSTMKQSNESQHRVQELHRFECKPPLRPVSAYNIFFQLQRERILNNDESSTERFTKQDVIDVVQERYNNWAGIVSRKNSRNKHDNNRKRHDKHSKKISFSELARIIGNKWKEADAETKALMHFYAKIERENYNKIKREAEAALNSSAGLNSDLASYTSSRSASASPSCPHRRRVSAVLNSRLSTNKSEKYNNNINMINGDKYDRNSVLPITNQQANMGEMEQLLKYSESASKNSFGVNDSNLCLLQDINHIPGIESYSHNTFLQRYNQQNMANMEAQLKCQDRIRQLRMQLHINAADEIFVMPVDSLIYSNLNNDMTSNTDTNTK